jgi:hypothetical protein
MNLWGKTIKPRRIRWAGHVARMGEERKVKKVLLGKPEGKRPLGRLRSKWDDGNRMNLGKIGWGSVKWIQFVQNRDRWRALVNTVMNLRIFWSHGYRCGGRS